MVARGRRAAGAVARRLPSGLVRSAARVRRRGSAVSVVVTVTDTNAPFLPDCVASLGAQTRRADEVVLVVLGTEPDTRAAVRQEVAASWRVRSTDLPGATTTAGLQHGAATASGDRLVLLDAGDRLVPGALHRLSAALDTGADVAGCAVADLGAVDLADLMLTRAAWERSPHPDAPPAAPYATWWTAARVVAGSTRAVPAGPARSGPRYGTGVAFGSMLVRSPWVEAWTAAVEDVLGRLADPALRGAATARLLSGQAQEFLEDAERCTPAQWQTLREALRRWQALATEPPAGVDARVRVALAVADRREELASFNVTRWADDGALTTRVEDGRVHALLPADVDPDLLVLTEEETPLTASVRRLSWAADGTVAVEVAAWARHVPSTGGLATLHVLDGHGTVVADLPTMAVRDPEVDLQVGDRHADHADACFRATLDPAALLRGARPGDAWSLEVTLDVAGVVRRGPVGTIDPRGSAGAFPPRRVGELTLRATPALPDGRLLLASDNGPTAPDGPLLTDVVVDGDLLVRVSGPAAGLMVTVEGPHAPAPVPLRAVDGGLEARLALCHDAWGLGPRPLPPGGYHVVLVHPDGRTVRPTLHPGLAARLPETQLSADFRTRVHRSPDTGGALLVLGPPLADDEVGPAAQQRLRRWYVEEDHRVDQGAVYLQAYTGHSATDSPLAIHHELRRVRPDLRLRWAVADSSVWVPEDAERVQIRSRAWYDALATSAYLVTNIDMEPWFVRRPGQRLLQSFHGYPSKAMGIAAWETWSFTPLRVEAQLRRTSGTWDVLLTPHPSMDRYYREQYRYDGEIVAAGYPRDDVLVGGAAGRLRAEARARLGLGEGQRAVLYAPTWRDDLATNFRAAPMTTSFDVERAAEALGEGYTILLRGHRFHRRRGARPGARLLDVTDYPEINDLVLAADVAVLDYSSLRFDVALAGRPMVFLVPDLERYTGGRGFLYDFRSSAPGPLLTSTDEVVERLRDLDGLARETAGVRASFNERFNALQDGHAAERAVAALLGGAPA